MPPNRRFPKKPKRIPQSNVEEDENTLNAIESYVYFQAEPKLVVARITKSKRGRGQAGKKKKLPLRASRVAKPTTTRHQSPVHVSRSDIPFYDPSEPDAQNPDDDLVGEEGTREYYLPPNPVTGERKLIYI